VRQLDGGLEIELDATFACPDYTLSLAGADILPDSFDEVAWHAADGQAMRLAHHHEQDQLLSANSWRWTEDRIATCFALEQGKQRLRLSKVLL
jgi:hypothetical protein